MYNQVFLKNCKPIALLLSLMILTACSGGSSPVPASLSATFSPSEITLNSSDTQKLKDTNQLTITTSTPISTSMISFAKGSAHPGDVAYLSLSDCAKASATTIVCHLVDTDPVTEITSVKVMVTSGEQSVEATPAGASKESSSELQIKTIAPSAPTSSNYCSFLAGAMNPCSFPQRANSAWLYDDSTACTGLDISTKQSDGTDPSLSIDPYATCSITMTPGANINGVEAFNKAINGSYASNSSLGLNEVNVYAGEIKFTQHIPSDPTSKLPLQDFKLVIKDINGQEIHYDGSKNIQAYAALAKQGISTLIAVVDGHTDSLGVANGWLWQSNTYNDGLVSNDFNDLAPAKAVIFADHIAEQFCNTNDGGPSAALVNGVQFDLEPFSIPADNFSLPAVCDPDDKTYDPLSPNCINLEPGWGQYLFYREISKDLAGNNTSDQELANDNTANTCSIAHPKFFTVNTLPNTTTKQHVATLLNSYKNGYAIFSLYDLGGFNSTLPRYYNDTRVNMNIARAGFVASSPSYYEQEVSKEMAQIQQQITDAPIYFQIAIPAAASTHEFAYSESAAYDGTKVDDRYAIAEPIATGSAIYPDCATDDDVLAVNSVGVGCATDVTSAATYQSAIVNDAMSATRALLTNSMIKPFYIGLSLSSFATANSSPQAGQVLANNHWIPRASKQDATALAFPNLLNIPNAPLTSTPSGIIDDQNKYVVCPGFPSYDASDYLISTVLGGCSNTASGNPSEPDTFLNVDSYSHTPDQYVGMRFYYPNSLFGGPLAGENNDIISETTQEMNVLSTLKSFPDLMSVPNLSLHQL